MLDLGQNVILVQPIRILILLYSIQIIRKNIFPQSHRLDVSLSNYLN